jgi:hypothetical protein
MKIQEDDFDRLPLDKQFVILLHKKIMNKTGSEKRRAKKYYTGQYRKSGIIPKPLLLACKGIMEGRKCSGRRRVLTDRIKERFVDMVKASSDPLDDRFNLTRFFWNLLGHASKFLSKSGHIIRTYNSITIYIRIREGVV